MEFSVSDPAVPRESRGARAAARRAWPLAVTGVLLLSGCTAEPPTSLEGLEDLGAGYCSSTPSAADWVALEIPLAVPADGKPFTIVAVDGNEVLPADVTDARPLAERTGGPVIVAESSPVDGISAGELSQLVSAYPAAWEARVDALGYTVQPGQSVMLVVPRSMRPDGLTGGETHEELRGNAQTWSGLEISTKQGRSTTTSVVDYSVTQVVDAECVSDPSGSGGFRGRLPEASDGGE